MTEKDKQTAERLTGLFPRLSDMDKERLLMFGEGMAIKAEEYRRAADNSPQQVQA